GKRKTLPMKIGIGNAGALAAFATLAAVAASPVPYFLRAFGGAYMLAVV
ncbi:MAG: geranylgeranylglycerol-phosphate geranylgeranyltransferase, partial [Deltaproteobacteria bacterium CG23_combo_of_CG06-09_8_20_14_all_60_8]